MKKSSATAYETTILPVLLLQNTMLQFQNTLLTKRTFFNNLKQLSNEDVIVSTEIAPLSRNEGPNCSTFNAKLGLSSDTFNTFIHNFEMLSKNCHVCGSTLYREYKNRVAQLEKYMMAFENQKRKIQDKQKQLVEKVKTLRFKTVPVSQSSTQTQTTIDAIIKKQIINIKTNQQRNDAIEKQVREQENKQNYLRYMQEIISKRQAQLDQRQVQLNSLQRDLNNEDIRFKTQPLNHLVDSKRMYQYFSILKDRIYDAVLKYQSGQPSLLKLLQNHPLYQLFERYEQNNINPKLKFQILKLLQINTLQQRYKLQVCEQYFYNESSKIEQLKRELEQKNIKFMQLNSYEHFLDRYRQLLDQRQDSLGERITFFKEETKVIMEYLDIKSMPTDNSEMSSSFSFLQHIDKDIKGNSSGRGRIFTLRQRTNNIIEQYKTINRPELQKQFLSEKINKMKEGYESQLSQIKRISDLQQQIQGLKSQLNEQTIINNKFKENQFNKQNRKLDNIKHSMVIDHPGKDFDKVLQEAARKKKIINVLTKMFKFSFFKNIKNPNFNKGLAWLVWRSKQYDLQAYDKIKQLAAEQYQDHEQEMWRRKSNILKKQKLFPYKSLSLNRKQFLQQFFDYERKQFFKDRLKALLLSITRNKIRKQKMIYIVYFHRFVRNSMLTNIPRLKLQKLDRLSQSKPPINSKNQKSSRALKPINQTNSRTTLSFDSNNTKRSSKIRDESSTKQCVSDKNSERNQYQKRYRKMLSCGKLSHILKDIQNRTKQQIASSFYILKDNFFGSKIAQIESLVDQISFDNNMFVTKFNICQSSLASKMSLLEEFLTIAPK